MKSSKYWGVSYRSKRIGSSAMMRHHDSNPWYCNVMTKDGAVRKSFPTEREAAIHADRINLEHRLGKPLNILKPKP